jgi:site-specific recombinase XerD
MNLPFVISKDLAGPDAGPLAAYVEPYVTLIRRQGYRTGTIRLHLQLIARFNRWLVRTHRDLGGINEGALRRFLRDRFGGRPLANGASRVLFRLLELMRVDGAAPAAKPSALSPADELIGNYRQHLLIELGLATSTVAGYEWYVRKFLYWQHRGGRVDLRRINLQSVIRLVREVGSCSGPRHTQLLVAALRSFVRFLFHRGKIGTDFAPSIPNAAHWTLAELPRYASTDAIQRTLNRCERRTPTERRNYAILLLLARLGLRGGEVLRINLEDIDWEAARITIRSAKGPGWARLPLPADAARAIAEYLRKGRPACDSRRIFLRACAPYTSLSATQAITIVARTALKRAGISIPRMGAHLFRHSLATGMLRRGASLDEIGQLLRHRSPNTTAVYAKVDLEALRSLALSWPGGVR